MHPERLSDLQLYALSINPKLDEAIKEAIDQELEKRQFDEDQLAKLAAAYKEKFADKAKQHLSFFQKTLIILFPFLPPSPIIAANRHSSTNKIWKQYWACVAIGIGVWAVLIILINQYLDHRK